MRYCSIFQIQKSKKRLEVGQGLKEDMSRLSKDCGHINRQIDNIEVIPMGQPEKEVNTKMRQRSDYINVQSWAITSIHLERICVQVSQKDDFKKIFLNIPLFLPGQHFLLQRKNR